MFPPFTTSLIDDLCQAYKGFSCGVTASHPNQPLLACGQWGSTLQGQSTIGRRRTSELQTKVNSKCSTCSQGSVNTDQANAWQVPHPAELWNTELIFYLGRASATSGDRKQLVKFVCILYFLLNETQDLQIFSCKMSDIIYQMSIFNWKQWLLQQEYSH